MWPLLLDGRSRATVELAEAFTDGLASREELLRLLQSTTGVAKKYQGDHQAAANAARACAKRRLKLPYDLGPLVPTLPDPGSGSYTRTLFPEEVACDLLRDVVGNPFHKVVVDPVWLNPTVSSLAQAAYEGLSLPEGTLDPPRLVVLADALEDAGCTNADLLDHLRGIGPHVRGCWPLDLLLSKE
jgi:hypothetical protein